MKLNKYTATVIIVMLFLFGITLFHASVDCGQDITGVEHTIVAVAFDTELRPFLEKTTEITSCSEIGITYHLLSHEGVEFIVYKSGVGPENASETTQKVIDTIPVKNLIFSGIAGKVHADHDVGHTLVAREWLNLTTGEKVAVDQKLLRQVESMRNVKIVDLGATSPVFVTDIGSIPEKVSLVDMETYEVARIAKERGVSFIAFRSISDNSDGEERDIDFMYAATQSSERVLEFLKISI